MSPLKPETRTNSSLEEKVAARAVGAAAVRRVLTPNEHSEPRTVCLYGAATLPYVESLLADLCRAAARRRREILPLTIEAAVARPDQWGDVSRLYVLPFDIPAALPADLPLGVAPLLRNLFPRAEIVNAPATHELCWDKIATTERLLDRGVPMPATVITHDPEEARRFVLLHRNAILKDPRSCGGHGDVVLFADEQGNLAGESVGRRYVVEFAEGGTGRVLHHGVLACRPPFYVQRLVTDVDRRGVLKPAQIVRAYIVGGQIVLWTERYRKRIRRPADFVISVGLGASYRFLPAVGESVRMLALRAAEVLDVRVGVVDLIRTGGEGPYVLEVDTDGQHMMIDRSFKLLPEFRPSSDFDAYLVEVLLAPPPEIVSRRPSEIVHNPTERTQVSRVTERRKPRTSTRGRPRN